MDLLASDLAVSVFVPTEWTGIKLEPYTLEVKPNIPAFLKAHVTPGIKTACPGIMDLLASDLALSVFVPTEWTGVKLEPYTFEVKHFRF